MRLITYLSAFLIFTLLSSNAFSVNDTPPVTGKISGGQAYELPTWFKESFLEIAEDVNEAKQNNKHVILFFHLNGCPYCNKMLQEGFEQEPLKSFIQANFDVIGINVKGDREVTFSTEQAITEQELSNQLHIQATPTVLFLDTDNNAVARLNGYRSAERFGHILHYVQEKAYKSQSLDSYLNEKTDKKAYILRDNPLFSQETDLAKLNGPVAVLFEDSSCDECNAFHDNMLSRPDVQDELKKYTVVRLDAYSEQPIVDLDGNKTTPKAWAQQLKLSYRPGIILFDEKKERLRIDGMLYSFHLKEMLRFVSGRYYQQYIGFLDYLGKRQEELIAQGININLTE